MTEECIVYMYVDERTIRYTIYGKNNFRDIEIPERGIMHTNGMTWIPDHIIAEQQTAVLEKLKKTFAGVRFIESTNDFCGT